MDIRDYCYAVGGIKDTSPFKDDADGWGIL
jgi:hypothetical protein